MPGERVPPPRLSPKPPGDDDLDPFADTPATITGVYRSVKHTINIRTVLVSAVALLVGVASLWTGQSLFIDKAEAAGKAAADAGIATVKGELAAMKEQMQGQQVRLENVEKVQQNTQSDVHEVMVDVRALYRSQQTGERSARLERPAPPPSSPDGGR